MGLFLVYLLIFYIFGWASIVINGSTSEVANGILLICSAALFLFQLAISWRYLLRRSIAAFQVSLSRANLIGGFAFALPLSLLMLFGGPILSGIGLFVSAVWGLIYLGIAISATMLRHELISREFPWDLLHLYEYSLNPNILKEYGIFAFLVVPLMLLSISVEPNLIAVALVLQFNALYTRIRMTIPIAAFLTTAYEKSASAWLELKRSAGERSIPGMALASGELIPKELAIHQDLVRVEDERNWIIGVKTLMKYCKFIVFDTHSVSDAVRMELELAEAPEHIQKVVFIARPNMHPEMVSAAARVAEMTGRSPVQDVREIAAAFDAERKRIFGSAAKFRPTDRQIGINLRTEDIRVRSGGGLNSTTSADDYDGN